MATMEQIRQEMPGLTDEELKELAKSADVEIESETATENADPSDNESDEEQEEVKEEVKQEPEKTVEEDEKPGKTVDYRALKEEREKRKAFAAKVAALEEELANLRKAPPQAPQQQQQAAPVVQPTQDYYDQLSEYADKEARKLAGIPDGEDVETLQFTDNKKYRKYQLVFNSVAQTVEQDRLAKAQVWNENQQFYQGLVNDPTFPTVRKYVEAEIDEMPTKKARPIEQAWIKLQNGQATREDREIISNIINKTKEKVMRGFSPDINQPVVQQPAVPNMVAKAAGLPRTSQLGGGGGKSGMMTAEEISRWLDDGRLDMIPKEMQEKILRGENP